MNSSSKNKDLAEIVVYNAMKILKDSGGTLSIQDLRQKIEDSVNFDDWAKATYEKSGQIRWQGILNFFSIDLIKAGYIVKKKGVWNITPDGEKALDLGQQALFKSASTAYRDWKEKNQRDDHISVKETKISSDQEIYRSKIDDIESIADQEFKRYILSKSPYEFQDMVGALLRAMGYHTPYIAPKGKDGGVDLIAYKDPLGISSPRTKVQVKHRQQTSSVSEIRELIGVLQKGEDVGIFVSTGGFSNDTRNAARTSQIHVELIDIDRFISLWQEFYSLLSDEDKMMMPIKSIKFVVPDE